MALVFFVVNELSSIVLVFITCLIHCRAEEKADGGSDYGHKNNYKGCHGCRVYRTRPSKTHGDYLH